MIENNVVMSRDWCQKVTCFGVIYIGYVTGAQLIK